MAEIVLHPNHWLFQQVAHPVCPECGAEIVPGTPVDIEEEGPNRFRFRHKGCAKEKE